MLRSGVHESLQSIFISKCIAYRLKNKQRKDAAETSWDQGKETDKLLLGIVTSTDSSFAGMLGVQLLAQTIQPSQESVVSPIVRAVGYPAEM